MHASDAAALFFPANEDEEDDDTGIYMGGSGDEQDVDGWDSRGGSPVDEGDRDAIPVTYSPILKENSTNTVILP
jgi:hypothetical protein